ncbi:MAG: protein translocase subunit SecD, partial [Opitutae bacterium]
MQDVITILRKRLDDFGVAEPVIRTRGDDMLEIQLPGLNSKDNAGDIEKLKAPAVLDFREVLPGGRTLYAPETPQDPGVQALPAGYTYLPQEVTNPDTGETSISWLPVEKRPDAAGDIIKQAFPIQNESGIGFKINMSFTPDGTKRFANITGEIAKKGGGQLAIVLDGVVRSAPGVDERISGGAEITGNFTRQEAVELANVLNNPLSVELELGEKYEVSPTLAKDSKEKSISAAKLGAILIIAFMVVYYFAGGIVAVCSVALNVLLVLGVLASLGATLTLPGVAALVLTVGMAVDANILIFERIREELNLGKSLENALNDGYNKAFSTIIDANLTTLITAGILFFLGTGPVRGFGLTLAVGIAASVFCALVVSRFLLETGVHGIGLKKVLGLKLIPDDRAWKFLERRKPLMIGSAVLIIAGVAFTGTNLQNILGIDFTGGDEITIEAASGQDLPTETEIHQIRDANENFKNAQVFYIQDLAGGKEQLKLQTDSEMGGAFFDALVQQYDDKGLQKIGESQIGGAVSKDIQKNAWLAVAFALVGILLYVAFRFELGYGIGAVAATIHDVLITIGLYVLLGKLGLCSGQFTAPMLAALLMILGYSINDTIVLFDRIREELKLRPDLSLGRIINFSVNRVLPRTILTSITTLLAASALYVYGAGIIRDFSFVFILGILTGTYSSIFIASPIFFWWHKGDRKHVEQREFLPKYDWNEDA